MRESDKTREKGLLIPIGISESQLIHPRLALNPISINIESANEVQNQELIAKMFAQNLFIIIGILHVEANFTLPEDMKFGEAQV